MAAMAVGPAGYDNRLTELPTSSLPLRPASRSTSEDIGIRSMQMASIAKAASTGVASCELQPGGLTTFEKKQQKELEGLLSEDSQVDWEQVRGFVGMPGLNPNIYDNYDVSTGHRAAYGGHADVLRWCLRTGMDVNGRTPLGRTMLHYACDGNRPTCVRLLLEQRADANLGTLSFQTPLMMCCSHRSYEAALELLLGKQVVDVDAEDQRRQTAESLSKDKRIVKAIQKYRRSFDERQKQALTEQAIWRLFQLYDRQGYCHITPDELREAEMVIASLGKRQISESSRFGDDGPGGEPVTPRSGTPRSGTPRSGERTPVSWEAFKKNSLAVIDSHTVDHRELLNKIVSLESKLLKEEVAASPRGSHRRESNDSLKLPALSPRSSKAALRSLNAAMHGESGSRKTANGGRKSCLPGAAVMHLTF